MVEVTARDRIPVLRPRLPTAARVQPYLERIDSMRAYSNWGPLAVELEERLAGRVGGRTAVAAASASSGSAAITGAVLAVAGPATPERPFAAIPAYTFVGTALAVQACGYVPFILDVRASDWQMDPSVVEDHPRASEFGVAVPVAPFGRAVSQSAWADLSRRTGIPVVIDGGASLDRVAAEPDRSLGDVPVAFSLHATKSTGFGEAGAVLGTPAVVDAIRTALNFGFSGSRETHVRAINGKLSEYAAAVGLAALDAWDETQEAFGVVADRYRAAAREQAIDGLLASPDIGSSYVLLEAPDHTASETIQGALRAAAIGHRLWYGHGLHRQPVYHPIAPASLPVTDELAPRIIGLPNAPDLDERAVEDVVSEIGRAMGTRSVRRSEHRPRSTRER